MNLILQKCKLMLELVVDQIMHKKVIIFQVNFLYDQAIV